MEEKLLTIAIPTNNRAKYLDKSLTHFTKQLSISNKNIDLIVSDNCSSDNTEEVVNKYIQLGYNIQYIKITIVRQNN